MAQNPPKHKGTLWNRVKVGLTKEVAGLPDIGISKREALRWGMEYNKEASSRGIPTIKMFNPVTGLLNDDAYKNVIARYGALIIARQKGTAIAREHISGAYVFDEFADITQMQIPTKSRPSDRVERYVAPDIGEATLAIPDLNIATRGKNASAAGVTEYIKGTNLALAQD